MSTNTDHNLLIRVITEDSILVSEDRDFAEDACYDWFSETVRQSVEGEIIQLIDESNGNILAEELKQ